MSEANLLRVYLEPPMLKTARAGSFNFLNQLRAAVEAKGWQIDWCETGAAARDAAPSLPGYALFHTEAPTHERALSFRKAYFYPFWQIEPHQQRWRFHVAETPFVPDTIPPVEARAFVERLRARVMPETKPARENYILIPLQGRIRSCRSFQTMSPLEMVETVAASGRAAVATFHPNESYSAADRSALQELAARYPNLQIGGDTQKLLPGCSFVATQNSAVAFEGFLLKKPAVLFGQSDFHHIALNVAELGAQEALARAPSLKPDFERYLFWFLRRMAINATAPDAQDQIRAAMKRGGWPI
ncbi:hypothetical protein [Paracoccus aminophilus]|uniref:Capsule polysaccharide biosynthesis protein n=1 Tax=Paracoccus aminophilus JCM 7686 TaxID=1367847 RepID=S5XYU4_PARAH|nr:hypothetical protein [Paracoccus aminophilus]AGT10472.1 hypothetical protein JCM7686_3437 [Paracoccus aminophilus JCM 7686]